MCAGNDIWHLKDCIKIIMLSVLFHVTQAHQPWEDCHVTLMPNSQPYQEFSMNIVSLEKKQGGSKHRAKK